VGLEYGLFPLTLTLSLGEREPPPARLGNFDALRFGDRQARTLPLPKGEGWGEGEWDARAKYSLRIGLNIRPLPS
jgi:hypothetical protein